jgi:hypothetical protein
VITVNSSHSVEQQCINYSSQQLLINLFAVLSVCSDPWTVCCALSAQWPLNCLLCSQCAVTPELWMHITEGYTRIKHVTWSIWHTQVPQDCKQFSLVKNIIHENAGNHIIRHPITNWQNFLLNKIKLLSFVLHKNKLAIVPSLFTLPPLCTHRSQHKISPYFWDSCGKLNYFLGIICEKYCPATLVFHDLQITKFKMWKNAKILSQNEGYHCVGHTNVKQSDTQLPLLWGNQPPASPGMLLPCLILEHIPRHVNVTTFTPGFKTTSFPQISDFSGIYFKAFIWVTFQIKIPSETVF